MSPLVYLIYINRKEFESTDVASWYSVVKLTEAFNKRGVNVELVPLNTREETPYTINKPAPDGAIVIDIIDYYMRVRNLDNIEIISQWDTVFLNDVEAKERSDNKLSLYQTLSSSGISVPNSYSSPRGDESITLEYAEGLISILGTPVVVKPALGYYGKDTFLCSDAADIVSKVNYIRGHNNDYVPIVIQEYVNDYNDIVIRVNVVGDYVNAYARVVSPTEDVKFNNDNKFKYRLPIKVPADLKDYILKAKDVLGIDAAACDVLVTNTGYKLIDVNTPGSFKVYDAICQDNFADRVAQCLYEKMQAAGKI